MSMTDTVNVCFVLVLTCVSIVLSVLSLAEPHWRHILVVEGGEVVLNGTEGLWEYCEDQSGTCTKLQQRHIGGWLVGVRGCDVAGCILLFLALISAVSRILGERACRLFTNKTKSQMHGLFCVTAAVLLLAAAMLYGEKVNYDEADYLSVRTRLHHNDVIHQSRDSPAGVIVHNHDGNLPQRNITDDVIHKTNDFQDRPKHVPDLPATSSVDIHTPGVDTLPPLGGVGAGGREEVVYGAEAGYCYHCALFSGIVALVACALSVYQSCRDNVDSGIERL